MMKPLRRIRNASAILFLLIAAIVVLLFAENTEPPSGLDGPQSYIVTDMSVAQVAAVAIKNGEAVFGLMVGKQNITVEPPDGTNYSQPELRAFIYSLCHLTGSRKFSDVSDPGEYGLDEPVAEVTLILTDGGSLRLLLGAESPLDGSRYLMLEGRSDVFLIGAEQAGYMLRTPRDFAERGIFPISGADELNKLERISVRHVDGEGRDFTIESAGDMRFTITEPIVSRLSTMTVVTELLLPTLALYPDEVISTDADKADYGLDSPDTELELMVDGEAYTCQIKRQPDGEYRICEKNGGIIYGIVAESVAFLRSDYLDLFGGFAYYQNASELSSVGVSFGETDLRLDLMTDENGEIIGTGNGGEYDSAEVSALTDALLGVRIASETDEMQQRTDITITFTEKSGSVRTIGISAPQDGLCTVSEDGQVNFTTTEAYATAIKSLAENINKKGE